MRLRPGDLAFLTNCAGAAARAAGTLIAQARPLVVEHKQDGTTAASTVVTDVDRQSQERILAMLEESTTRFALGVLSEESHDDGSRLTQEYFWSIDPLDGTLAFVESRPGFAVSIALVSRAGKPLLGVVYDPSADELFSAIANQGITCNGEPWLPPPPEPGAGLRIFADRSLASMPKYSALLEALHAHAQSLGGEGVELTLGYGAVMNACHVLRHPPACYFKFPKTEPGGGALWDFAASACLFAEAGAIATDIEGAALALNKTGSTWMNERGVLFASDAKVASVITGLYKRFG